MTVPQLPRELWHQTIGHFNKVTSLPDLKALCPTSEFFRAIAQPKLFETLRLSMHPFLDADPRRAEGILQLLSSRPESRNWTSNLTIRGLGIDVVSGNRSTTNREREDSQRRAATIRSVFLQMRGLQRMKLLHSNLTPEMYSHLYHLQHLQELSLLGLTVAEMPHEIPDAVLPLIKLRIQHCLEKDDESVAMKFFQPLLCSSLQTLSLDPRTADIVFRYIARNSTPTFPSLLSFNVHPSPEALPDLPSLFAFLRSCPNLSRFVLPANSFPLQDSPSNHARGFVYHEDVKDCVTEMSSIRASADLVRLLLPGRPFHDIEAFLDLKWPLALDESALEPYRSGAVPLKKLSLGAVTWTHNSLEVLARGFPDLELLSLKVLGESSSDWYNDDLGCRIAAFKHLDSTIVPLDEHDELWEESEAPEKERKILAQAEEHGSHITYMCLGQHDVWTKRGDGTWASRFETCG